MISIIQRADAWLIDRVAQPIADFVVDHGGPMCFDAARIALMGWFGCNFAFEVREGSLRWAFFDALGLGIWWLVVHDAEKEFWKNPKFMNMERSKWIFRAIFVPLSMLIIFKRALDIDMLMVCCQLSWISALYFVACTPRPPKPKPVKISDTAAQGAGA